VIASHQLVRYERVERGDSTKEREGEGQEITGIGLELDKSETGNQKIEG
jgi:hypothetical protein